MLVVPTTSLYYISPSQPVAFDQFNIFNFDELVFYLLDQFLTQPNQFPRFLDLIILKLDYVFSQLHPDFAVLVL